MNRPCKQEERHVARLLGGSRYPGNSGGRVNVESDRYVCQIKNVSRLSLAQLERLVVEMEGIGHTRGKCGLVIVKRRAGKGCRTERLVCMTEGVWCTLTEMLLPHET